MEYGVEELKADKVIRVEFRIGFRVQQRVSLMFRKVVTEMICNKELDIASRFPSLKKHNIADDFRFVILEKFLSYDNEFSVREGFILNTYFSMKKIALAEEKAFGLDSSETIVEKLPLVVAPITRINLHRAYYHIHHPHHETPVQVSANGSQHLVSVPGPGGSLHPNAASNPNGSQHPGISPGVNTPPDSNVAARYDLTPSPVSPQFCPPDTPASPQ
jgi:hypothetical protein